MTDTCANPLLLGWIKEWLDQARERNSKGVTVYKKAYDSMKACPLVFNHPSEAQQLNGLGPKLCDRLTEKLKAYCEENGLPMPEPPHKASKKRTSGDALPENDNQPAKKPKKARPYVPALRSGPYALLLGLSTLDENSSQGLTKAQLIELAQPHCDSSFTAPPDPTKFYTAWNSMKTLIQKDLVYEHGRPLRKYLLTEEGWEVAKRIRNFATGSSSSSLNNNKNKTVPEDSSRGGRAGSLPVRAGSSHPRENDNDDDDVVRLGSDPPPPGPTPSTTTERPARQDRDSARPPHGNGRPPSTDPTTTIKPIPLPPGSFSVQLVLDTREVRTSTDRDYISNELIKKGITPQVRALELGDAMWVAKCHDPTFLSRHCGEDAAATAGESGNDEVMLDWIVERKRLDDLIGSIKDGRFHEQKFRLRRSGMKNVVYLIEEFNVSHGMDPSNPNGGMKYQEMVASAIASTQVVNGYFVKKTRNLDDTIRYLARMTFLLRSMYESSSTTPDPAHKVALIPSTHPSLSSSPSYLSLLSHLRATDPTTTYAVTFPTFSAMTSKSDVLSLRDVFLKMLMCTRGVTGDKALEIQRRWRTPREFVEAFEALGDGKERKEVMVSEKMKDLIGRKKVAKTLSRRIAEVWGEAG
ncbi:hypothetical protein VTN00DRAFT_8331 [Thermoascus crustaceus]|uniref:uncharacterized protein n=1 Tax=Thermoascus crustaceus TaxID=5088 RepID=UPI0037442B24